MAVAYNPKTVTDGLVFCMDAANRRSYPGTGTTWYDLSGNNNHGTLVNGVSYINGKMNFDGTNDYVSVGSNTSAFENQSVTVSMWVYYSAIQNHSVKTLIDFDHSTSPYQGWTIQSENATTGKHYYFAYYDGSVFQPTGGFGSGIGVALPQSKFCHLAFTKQNANVVGYLNGTAVFNPAAGTNATISYQGGRPLIIATNYALINLRCVNGLIDDIRIYNRALSPQQIRQNYNATKGRFNV